MSSDNMSEVRTGGPVRTGPVQALHQMLFDSPLVAGCSTGHKPCSLHVNEWDFSQKNK